MTRAKLIAIARVQGVMLIDGGDTISADAPPGGVLACGSHSTTYNTEGWTRSDLYDELARDIGAVSPCDEADCETCAEGLGFDELHALYRGDRLA